MGFWKEILKEADWVSENWRFRIGNGSRVRYHWCGSSALNLSFPFLFELVVNKQETRAEV